MFVLIIRFEWNLEQTIHIQIQAVSAPKYELSSYTFFAKLYIHSLTSKSISCENKTIVQCEDSILIKIKMKRLFLWNNKVHQWVIVFFVSEFGESAKYGSSIVDMV